MDQEKIIQFLLAHRQDLGEKLQNAPQVWIFQKNKLPDEIKPMVEKNHVALLLLEDIDGSWYTL